MSHETEHEDPLHPADDDNKPFRRLVRKRAASEKLRLKADGEAHSYQDEALEAIHKIKTLHEPTEKAARDDEPLSASGHVRKTLFSKFFRWVIGSPTRTITIGFAFTILIGGFLLTLPISSQSGAWTAPIVGWFTATSATCVTGLVVVDTATYWSHFGQLVIAALIQIGGLGIVTIMSFFLLAARRRVSFKTLLAMQESTGSDSFVGVGNLVKRIFAITFTCEFIGGTLLAWRYIHYMPLLSAIRRAYFQAVSAFCNAGFDLMGDIRGEFTNLNTWNNEPLVLIVTASLIITGGLGFVVWSDLLAFRKRRKLEFHSRLVLKATFALIVSGMIAFSLLEWNNMHESAMGTLETWQKPIAGFFQSVTLRTAGFNSIDQVTLTQPSKVIACLLMFIGAGPASTGGGIKNTTFLVIAATAVSYLRGNKHTILGGRKISSDVFTKALIILCLGLAIVGGTSFLLLVLEHGQVLAGKFDYIDLLFESTSAFATVGNSTTPTVSMSAWSWGALIPAMYLGRVGPASFAMGFTLSSKHKIDKVYPEGRTFVG